MTGTAAYRLRGSCLARSRTQTALLGLRDVEILAEPADVRQVSGAVQGALERYSADFLPPEEGQEWEVFGLPDARRDWMLSGILLVCPESLARREGAHHRLTRGAGVQVEAQEQLRRSADPEAGNRYLLDLGAA